MADIGTRLYNPSDWSHHTAKEEATVRPNWIILSVPQNSLVPVWSGASLRPINHLVRPCPMRELFKVTNRRRCSPTCRKPHVFDPALPCSGDCGRGHTGGGVPDLHRLVAAAGGDGAVVAGVRHPVDRRDMPRQLEPLHPWDPWRGPAKKLQKNVHHTKKTRCTAGTPPPTRLNGTNREGSQKALGCPPRSARAGIKRADLDSPFGFFSDRFDQIIACNAGARLPTAFRH